MPGRRSLARMHARRCARSRAETVQLPSAPPGEILAEQITATGGTITVTGMNFRTDPVTAVTWTSDDGGRTWSLV